MFIKLYEYDMSMTKVHTNLTIDSDLLEKAKEQGIKLSMLLENNLLKVLKIKDVQIDMTHENCQFCGSYHRKATAKKLDGLTWLWPDEKWICNDCLSAEKRKVIHGSHGANV